MCALSVCVCRGEEGEGETKTEYYSQHMFHISSLAAVSSDGCYCFISRWTKSKFQPDHELNGVGGILRQLGFSFLVFTVALNGVKDVGP